LHVTLFWNFFSGNFLNCVGNKNGFPVLQQIDILQHNLVFPPESIQTASDGYYEKECLRTNQTKDGF
jgi:hypothetical protein